MSIPFSYDIFFNDKWTGAFYFLSEITRSDYLNNSAFFTESHLNNWNPQMQRKYSGKTSTEKAKVGSQPLMKTKYIAESFYITLLTIYC